MLRKIFSRKKDTQIIGVGLIQDSNLEGYGKGCYGLSTIDINWCDFIDIGNYVSLDFFQEKTINLEKFKMFLKNINIDMLKGLKSKKPYYYKNDNLKNTWKFIIVYEDKSKIIYGFQNYTDVFKKVLESFQEICKYSVDEYQKFREIFSINGELDDEKIYKELDW